MSDLSVPQEQGQDRSALTSLQLGSGEGRTQADLGGSKALFCWDANAIGTWALGSHWRTCDG